MGKTPTPAVRIFRDVLNCTFLAGLFALIHVAVYRLRFDGPPEPRHAVTLATTLAAFTAIKVALFAAFRAHRGWSRFVAFHDLLALAKATTSATVAIVVVERFWSLEQPVSRGIIVLDWGATLIVVCALRSAARAAYSTYVGWLHSRSSQRKQALIVGANAAGEGLLRSLQVSKHAPYDVVGFVDIEGRHVGDRIAGVSIVGALAELPSLVARHAVDEVLITAGDLTGLRVRQVMTECETLGVRVRMLPSFEQLLSGNMRVTAREVSIDDLLRRDPVRLDTDQIHDWLEGRVLMVTGSAGSIGSEICRQLLQFRPARIVLVDRWENGQFQLERQLRALSPQTAIDIRIADVADRARMGRLFAEVRPDVLFHAAAYKHVPLMEQNPGEAVKNNVVATRGLADLADEFGLQAFVMISSDKAVNPTSVMGACKRAAELYVQSLADRSQCRFVTVRFGNVLDSAGSVVPIFREQIQRGGPITVTDPRMQRFFMTIPEAAQLVIQAGSMGRGGEIFVLEMGEPVKIVDLAQDLVRLSGLRVGQDIEIRFTGLRPGEKLFEELHVTGEEHQATHHPKIQVVQRSTGMTKAQIHDAVDQLATLVDEEAAQVIEALQRLVVEYRPDFVAPSGLRLFLPDETSKRSETRVA